MLSDFFSQEFVIFWQILNKILEIGDSSISRETGIGLILYFFFEKRTIQLPASVNLKRTVKLLVRWEKTPAECRGGFKIHCKRWKMNARLFWLMLRSGGFCAWFIQGRSIKPGSSLTKNSDRNHLKFCQFYYLFLCEPQSFSYCKYENTLIYAWEETQVVDMTVATKFGNKII